MPRLSPLFFIFLLAQKSTLMQHTSLHASRFFTLFRSLVLYSFVLCLVSACSLSSGGRTSYPSGQPAGAGSQKSGGKTTINMFPPMSQSGSVKLSEKEAKALVSKLNPRQQKMRKWADMDFAVSQSLAYARAKSAGTVAVNRQGLSVTYGTLANTLQHLQAILPKLDNNPNLLVSDFTWYRLGPDFGITGYYEPTLSASRTKSAKYPYPLYKTPADLKKGVRYHSRNQIDRKGSLAGKGLEIAYVSSEVDAFFLHIQGSGRLVFPDGTVTHVLYANKNNQAYVPLGRIMRDEGLLAPDNISMQTIREVLANNPHRQSELLDKNPSYIFFREAAKGPIGAMGRTLTPYVSTATDRSVLPHGAVNFTMMPLPDQNGDLTRPFYALTLPQDTGGAIKNNRIDLFCGPGEDAHHTAGYLDAKGAVYILVKK